MLSRCQALQCHPSPALFPNGPASSLLLMLLQAFVQQSTEVES